MMKYLLYGIITIAFGCLLYSVFTDAFMGQRETLLCAFITVLCLFLVRKQKV